MGTPRWRVWLHRIGYVTTAIVVVEICFVGIVLTTLALRQHRLDAARRAETAYREGSFRGRPDWIVPHLASLPRLGRLAPDGFRFVADPSLDDAAYAMAFRLDPYEPTAKGLLVMRQVSAAKVPENEQRYSCEMPAKTYRALVSEWDRRLDGFTGDEQRGTDGTTLAFERVRGSRITSGSGNYIEPYQSFGEVVLRYARAACPHAPLPNLNENWYSPD